MRNYLYISKSKLDIYFPQTTAAQKREHTAKAGVNVGVMNAELSVKSMPQEDDHRRLQAVLDHLSERGLLGTIDDPRQFFAGEIDARSIIHDSMAFFAAFRRIGDQTAWLGLTCSLRHMIGHGYKNLENFSQRDVGPTRSQYFVQTSSSLGFAQQLRTIWRREADTDNAQCDPDLERRAREQAHQLTPRDQELIAKGHLLNRAILYVHPEGFLVHFFREWLLSFVFDPLMRLRFGREEYKTKIEALHRQTRFIKTGTVQSRFVFGGGPSGKDANEILSNQEKELLSVVRRVAKNIDAPAQRYSFVALRLLQGETDGEPVLLGSPLYLATNYGEHRENTTVW